MRVTMLVLMMMCGLCAVRAEGQDSVSATLQPALATLQQTLETLRVDKWKASGTVRDEAEGNIGSIQRDVTSTLPQLMKDADAAPGSMAKVLPAYRNVEALYNVLLRVASAGRVAAPDAQSAALEDAVKSLSESQRALGERLQGMAVAQEKQIGDLQTKLKAAPATPEPVACPAPAPAPVKKKSKAKSAATP